MKLSCARKWLFCLSIFSSLVPLAAWGDSNDEILIVALGGYNSCKSSSMTSEQTPYGMDMYVKANEMSAKLSQLRAKKVRYVYGCLFSSPPPNGEGSFVTSDKPGEV